MELIKAILIQVSGSESYSLKKLALHLCVYRNLNSICCFANIIDHKLCSSYRKRQTFLGYVVICNSLGVCELDSILY